MRIFCGLAKGAQKVAAAVVDERGGVIATSNVTDDPYGYLQLCRIWVRHSEPSAVSLADDGTSQTLRELAAAAGQPTTATSSEHAVDDALDTAVQIARALAQGELTAAVAGGTPEAIRNLVNSMRALTIGECAAQGALIELLRECHPATLAAWEDPTEPGCLEVLRTLPEPAHAAKADPKRLAESLREVADPARIEELATALSRAARNRELSGVEPAEAIAAQSDATLAASYAARSVAGSLATLLEKPEPEPAAAASAPGPIPRPRRTEIKTQAAPQVQPPLARSRNSAPTPPAPVAEPDTAPLPLPPDEASDDTGFPLMPPPPEFVDPSEAEEPVLDEQENHGDTAAPTPPPRRHARREDDLLAAPAGDLPELEDADDDLLIFSQARSAWFKGPGAIEDTQEEWSFEADEGWRAAEAASANLQEAAETTVSGLPRRVPQANLVPGSAILSDQRPVPIKRDATALASRTAGYFRGWSRARRETVGAGMGS